MNRQCLYYIIVSSPLFGLESQDIKFAQRSHLKVIPPLTRIGGGGGVECPSAIYITDEVFSLLQNGFPKALKMIAAITRHINECHQGAAGETELVWVCGAPQKDMCQRQTYFLQFPANGPY